jgi:hypothetical protein
MPGASGLSYGRLDISNSSDEYVERIKSLGLPYHIPLKTILLKRSVVLQTNWIRVITIANINPDFVFPEVLAVAMNSVVSDFNPNAPDPRLYSTNDTALSDDMNIFHQKSSNYYEIFMKK